MCIIVTMMLCIALYQCGWHEFLYCCSVQSCIVLQGNIVCAEQRSMCSIVCAEQ